MSRHDYAVLTLRGFAIYAWFSALQYFSNGFRVFFEYLGALSHEISALGLLVTGVIHLLIGLFLFARSRELAAWLMPAPQGEPPAPPAIAGPPHPLLAASVAFAVVGVAIFLNALPTVLTPLITLMEEKQLASQVAAGYYEIPRIIAGAIQMALGFVLFLNSRTFAITWWRKQWGSESGK